MKTALLRAGVAVLAFTSVSAHAAGIFDAYSMGWIKAIPTKEASSVTYNWDANTLMITNDEEDGNNAHIDEYDMNGVRIAALTAPGCGSFTKSKCDPEGLTYIGNGKYALGEERPRNIQAITKTSATTFSAISQNAPTAARNVFGDGNFDNEGLESLAYDAATNTYWAAKQTGEVVKITGAVDGDFTSATISGVLFNAVNSLGLDVISDIAVLSNSVLANGVFGDDLLILGSKGSGASFSDMIYQMDQSGNLIASWDLTGFKSIVDPLNNDSLFEGITLDRDGNIYVVSDDGDGRNQSYMVKLQYTAPAAVPEPASWAMMVAGFGLVGFAARRRGAAAIA